MHIYQKFPLNLKLIDDFSELFIDKLQLFSVGINVMFNFKIANARYINVHQGSRSSFFIISCIVPLSLVHHLNTMRAPFIGTSLSTTNGKILMHDESAILSTINAPFIFFVSVSKTKRTHKLLTSCRTLLHARSKTGSQKMHCAHIRSAICRL